MYMLLYIELLQHAILIDDFVYVSYTKRRKTNVNNKIRIVVLKKRCKLKENVVIWIEKGMLRWFGHLERRELKETENPLAILILHAKSMSSR